MRGVSHILTESEKRLICELYPEKTIEQLAKEFKIGKEKVSQILKRSGIEVKKHYKKANNLTALSDQEIKEIVELYSTSTIPEIAKAYHISTLRVCDILDKHGIVRRYPGERVNRASKTKATDHESVLHDIKKEEIAMPVQPITISAAAVTNAKTFPAPTLKPVKEKELPPILTHAMDVLQRVYFTPTDADVTDDLDEIFNQAVSMASDILFAPKNLVPSLRYEEYTRLITVNDILKRILLKIEEQQKPWYDEKDEEMRIHSGNWYSARLFLERAVSILAGSD
jgi:phage antirepressor YoqD-like protein